MINYIKKFFFRDRLAKLNLLGFSTFVHEYKYDEFNEIECIALNKKLDSIIEEYKLGNHLYLNRKTIDISNLSDSFTKAQRDYLIYYHHPSMKMKYLSLFFFLYFSPNKESGIFTQDEKLIIVSLISGIKYLNTTAKKEILI
ncbi:hypothetical protein H0178_06395 [Cytobacillus firmus]|nr:hypothetical protein [Cytobacillus firmus]